MKKKHEHRTDLAGEHFLTDIGQIIGFFLFLAVWILDSFIFKFSTFLTSYISHFIRIPLGAILLISSLYMALTTHKKIFGEAREKPGVIKEGFFRYTRHPLYLSEIIAYKGLFIFSLSLFSLIIIMSIFLFLNYAASYEEKKLEALYGEDYLKYKRNTGKWFLKIRIK